MTCKRTLTQHCQASIDALGEDATPTQQAKLVEWIKANYGAQYYGWCAWQCLVADLNAYSELQMNCGEMGM